jgi:Ca-activated chloride channel family protein
VSFIWPFMLALLLIIPVGAAAYLILGGRRRRKGTAYGQLLGASPGSRSRRSRRYVIVPALTALGMATLLVALARPQAVVSLPRLEGTVILAFDVSGSMAATDFSPTRMEAAKAAAREFVARQPASVQVGVVAFSDSGIAVQAATNDQAAVIAAINRLTPQRGTSLARGILISLDAIDKAENPTKGYYGNRSPEPSSAPVAPGSHRSAVVVLLTDGENNEDPDPLEAARTAADRGVRIDTVGMGTPGGTTLEINGFRVHTQLNADLLGQVAQLTAGTFHDASNQAELDAIYDNLEPDLVVREQPIEITSIVAAVGLATLVAASALSLVWLGRIP